MPTAYDSLSGSILANSYYIYTECNIKLTICLETSTIGIGSLIIIKQRAYLAVDK